MLTPCTQELKDVQTESRFEVHLVMRTPVITGRVVSVESRFFIINREILLNFSFNHLPIGWRFSKSWKRIRLS